MRKPYLVQRAIIKRPLPIEGTILTDSLKFDYMGASEFEFGALPASLRAFEAATVRKKSVVPNIKAGDVPLKVFHFMGDPDFEQYVDYLRQMREGTLDLMEPAHFEANPDRRFNRPDFWWDIRNHVMWSFDKEYMNRLPAYLEASWKLMNAPRAKT